MNFLYTGILFLMLIEVLRPKEIHGLALNLTSFLESILIGTWKLII